MIGVVSRLENGQIATFGRIPRQLRLAQKVHWRTYSPLTQDSVEPDLDGLDWWLRDPATDLITVGRADLE